MQETELFCFKGPRLRAFFLVIKCVIKMEHWWNVTDRGKLKYSDKELPQCHIPSKMLHGLV
jgi:hypothetical protein